MEIDPTRGTFLPKTEKVVYTRLCKKGYKIFKNGWPDFAICRNGKIKYFIEVKSYPDIVMPHQKEIHEILRRSGFKVKVIWVDSSTLKITKERLHVGRWPRKGINI